MTEIEALEDRECRCGEGFRYLRTYLGLDLCRSCGRFRERKREDDPVLERNFQAARRGRWVPQGPLRKTAVNYLRTFLREEEKAVVRSLGIFGVEGWQERFHHGLGTRIRNGLRAVGMGESAFGRNLDEVYLDLVTEACGP